MDIKAFDKMNYGLYIVSTKSGDQTAGCVVNTLTQATVQPARLLVTIHKDNQTERLIEESGVFAAVALAQSAQMELIGDFGFRCSRDLDKFANWAHTEDENAVPYLTEQTVARYSCRVVGKLDAGTHMVFLGEVQEAQVLEEEDAMTYAYYHLVKKGLTPPKLQLPAGTRCKRLPLQNLRIRSGIRHSAGRFHMSHLQTRFRSFRACLSRVEFAPTGGQGKLL